MNSCCLCVIRPGSCTEFDNHYVHGRSVFPFESTSGSKRVPQASAVSVVSLGVRRRHKERANKSK